MIGRNSGHQEANSCLFWWPETYDRQLDDIFAIQEEIEENGLDEQFLHFFYKPLHNSPCWALFFERIGSSAEQLAAIEFKVARLK